MTKMIKKYSQFIKENKQVKTNEEFDQEEFDNSIDDREEDFEPEGAEVEDNEVYSEAEEEIGADEPEGEEGDGYIGQRMIQELADALDVQVDADGSILYNDQKINFFSETEMFHVGSMKFETVDEVVAYLNNDSREMSDEMKADEEADDMKNDEILRQRELEDEDDRALLAGEGDEDDLEPELESKSYKYTRKFESFRK